MSDRFRIINKLGAGGMGVVYRVFDEERGTELALKRASSPGPDALYRLKREFRARAGLAHPNLVHLYELIAEGDHCAFTMELVEGVSFLKWIQGLDGDGQVETAEAMDLEATLEVVAERVASNSPLENVSWDGPTLESVEAALGRGGDLFEEPTTPLSSATDDVAFHAGVSGATEDVGPVASGSQLPATDSSDLPTMVAKNSVGASPAIGTESTPSAPSSSSYHEMPTIASSDAGSAGRGTTHFTAPVKSAIAFDEHRERRLRAGLVGLLRGLNALHEAGQVHRDIKSSNVMVARDGRVVILDFGLTGTLARYDAHSGASDLAGTPTYMAPEQLTSKGTPATDLYAVGVLLFESLIGRPPFEGKLLQVLQAKSKSPAPHPLTLNEDLPDDLAQLAADLLERDPEARPTAKEALERLNPRRVRPAKKRSNELVGSPQGTDEIDANTEEASPTGIVFRGREPELENLEAARAHVNQTLGPSLVRLVGPSGSGKTRLVQHFVEGLPSDTLIFASACNRSESIPFQGVDAIIDKVAQHLCHLNRSQRKSVMPRRTFALKTLFPTLAQVPEIDAESMPATLMGTSTADAELRQLGFGAFRELLGRLASEKPVVLWVDDLQWCDRDSISLLLETVSAEDAPEVLLLTSYRVEDRGSSGALSRWEKLRFSHGRASEIELEPLNADHALGIIEQLSPSAPSHLKAAAVTRAEGNPFMAVELGRFLSRQREAVSELPEDVLGSLIEQRLESLDEDDRALVEAVALANAPLTPEVALQAAGGEERSQLKVQWLCDGHLLRETSSDRKEVTTYHDSLRETVVSAMSEAGQRDTHRRLANAIETSSPESLEDLFFHWQGAGETKKAIEAGLSAAERASGALAFGLAANLYERTLELLPESERDGEVLEAYARALANGGRGRDAADNYLLAAQRVQGREKGIVLRRSAAEQLLKTGYTKRGWAELRGVLADLGISVPRSSFALIAGSTWRRLKFLASRLPKAEDCGEEHSLSDAQQLELETLWIASTSFSMINVTLSDHFRTQHMARVLRRGSRSMIARVLAYESAMESHLGGKFFKKHSMKLLRHVRSFVNLTKDPYDQAWFLLGRANYFYNACEWSRCAEYASRAEKIFETECVGADWERATVRHYLFDAQIHMGEFESLSRSLQEALSRAEANDNVFAAMSVLNPDPLIVWISRGKGPWALQKLEELQNKLDQQEKSSSGSVHHLYQLFAQIMSAYSEGDYHSGYKLLRDSWAGLKKHYVLNLQIPKIFVPFSRALGALGMLHHDQLGGFKREELIRDVENISGAMAKDDRQLAHAVGLCLEGGVAQVQGDLLLAEQRLRSALAIYENHGANSGVLTCHFALSRLSKGPGEGPGENGLDASKETRAIERWLSEQGVTAPEPFFRVRWPF